MIDLHMGEWPPGLSDVTGVAVTRWIVADRPGTLDQVEFPQWSDPRVRDFEVLKNSGDVIRPPFD
ncbi:hypothetical protein AAER40_27935, partial [Klebsiella pneumoniae]|uniref:hypothetical protein n=1 Tax=Klebsiella pneumoniae TaxID=573 RepID=UPI0031357491